MAPAQVPVPPDDGVAKMIGNLNANLAKATGSGVSNASANNRLTTYNDHRTFNNSVEQHAAQATDALAATAQATSSALSKMSVDQRAQLEVGPTAA
jgi:hypothetical protein